MRGPTPLELEARGPREGGAAGLPSASGASRPKPSCLCGRQEISRQIFPLFLPPPPPRLPQEPGSDDQRPQLRVAAPTFPGAKLSAGPQGGVFRRKRLGRGGSGRGRGAQSRDRGERERRGEVPRGRGLRRPRRDRKAGPLPPGFESSRVHDASVPTGETERDPSPDRKEYGGRARGCSGSWGGPGGRGAWGPSAEPQGPAVASDPPPRYLGSRVWGAAAQRGGGRGDAEPLKGGTRFGHLGREEKEKGREKREKERRTGRARRRAGGAGAATRAQAGLRASPGRGW